MRRLLPSLLLCLVLAPGVVRAGVVGCAFDETTATLTATGTTIRRAGDAITMDGQPCGTATVMNTDDISVEGSGDLVIDLRGGPLAPGSTPEAEGIPEIEITVLRDEIGIGIIGSAEADRIKPATDVGEGTIHLNATEMPKDPDVSFAQAAVDLLLIESRGGNDSVVAHGHGTKPYVGDLWFFAGNGNDRFVPGTPVGGSAFVGSRGRDAFDISWLPESRSFLDLRQQGGVYGPGDWLSSLTDVEEIVGHIGRDEIYGTDGSDDLLERGGRDLLIGRGGDDHISSEGKATIDAGPGYDECLVFPEVVSIKRCEIVQYAVV